ncbi:MAG: PAS domain-containing sensor histidine kinase [Methylobacteriaceae bacterium]|nr:PAS domain-containing sensor histidine kinase [Methylobacteriaceae bacterium]
MQASNDIERSIARGFDRHGLGFARVAPGGAVIEREGAAVGWLPEPGGDCFATPLLIGMEDEFAALRAGRLPLLALPAIGLADGEKAGVTIVWDEAEGCFSIAAARAFGASETEIMLARERRERRLADEQAEAARGRANVSEALYRDIVDTSADLVLRLTAERSISFANRRMAEFCGQPLDALVGRNVADVLPAGEGADWSSISSRSTDLSFEQKLTSASGRTAWIWWRAAWLGAGDGPPEYQAVGRDVTRLRQLQAEVERANAQARSALVMRERLKIAHDLHDTIVHALVAVVAQLRLVRKLIARAPDKVEAEIARAEEAARAGLERGREALGQVRFQRAGVEGLAAALRRAAERFEQRAGLPVRLEVEDPAIEMDGERAEILYRIVEEALRNIEIHADARHVSLAAAARDGEARIVVSDDGRGFDPNAPNPGHYGLVGMDEQARMIGGRLSVESSPGRGARLTISAPIHAQE